MYIPGMAGQKGKKIVGGVAVAAAFLALCAWILTRPSDQEKINQRRAECQAPKVFRLLNPAGNRSDPANWVCLSQELAAQLDRNNESTLPADGGSPATPSPPSPPSDPFWDAAEPFVSGPGRDCHEDLWALFDEYAGGEPEEKVTALRDELEDRVFRLRSSVILGTTDSGEARVTFLGLLECRGPSNEYTRSRFDRNAMVNPRGDDRMFLAIGDVKIEPNEVGDLGVGNFVTTAREWTADGRAEIGTLPLGDADLESYEASHPDLKADIAFRLRNPRIDKRTATVRNRATREAHRLDVGAGPIVDAEIVAVRLRDGSGNVVLDTTPE